MERRLLLGPSVFYVAPGSALSPSDSPFAQIPFEQMRSSFMFPFNPLFTRSVTFTFVKLVRFINWVKQVIDRDEGIGRMTELLDDRATRDDTSRFIVERLLRERRLVWYDESRRAFSDEPADQGLVASFFEKARGRKIKGFKSSRSILMDM